MKLSALVLVTVAIIVNVAQAQLSPERGQGFPIGYCSVLPTAKTGAAVRKQAPILVQNLISAIQGQPLEAKYDRYTSCPIVTGYGKLVLAYQH